jgi:hypothetical protein
MSGLDTLDTLFVIASLGIQSILLVYFALRKWAFPIAMRWGWIVYALALPALALSVAQLMAGKVWYLWLAGILYVVWAVFGAIVDLVLHIEWRGPVYLPVLLPYILLYLGCQMFYWWPLLRMAGGRPLWFVYTVLFVISTLLNVTSHPPLKAD